MQRITIEVTDEVADRLAVLADPMEGLATIEVVVAELVDHVNTGIWRPGSWERSWLQQAFGDRWLRRLEPDPDARMFDRIKAPDFLP